MQRSAWGYSAVELANQVLPENAVVISGLTSVALFSHDFLPTDWLAYKDMNKEYFLAIGLKKPNFIIFKKNSLKNSLRRIDFAGCVGEIYSGPKYFKDATRNPFNSGKMYSVTIHRFNSALLPSCKK